jgi:type IV pilus assembly protein PilC
MPLIVTPRQLNRRSQLYFQLAGMIEAGVPVMKALDMASRHPEMRNSRLTIDQLTKSMESGFTFTESMTRVHGWMPEFDVALLTVGEEAGRLDQSLRTLATFYEYRAKIIHDTIAGLVVTVATLHVFILVFPISYLQSFAVGLFNQNFALCLPFLLEKAAVFGILYFTVFFFIFACQGQRGEGWRSVVETIFNFVPILRTARKYLALSRLAAALGASTRSGVSIVSGWELASAAGGSPRLRRIISDWQPYINSGTTHGELINQDGYFPEMFGNFYFTGEQSGRLDEALDKLQVYYQDEGFRLLRWFTKVLNGFIYGGVAALVGYEVIMFWKHYYENLLNGI